MKYLLQKQRKQKILLSIFVLALILVPFFSQAQGANMSNPIVMGTYGAGTHTYSDTRNTSSYGNDYGQISADIFYQFTVNGTTTISISTCGSGWDTYLHLLNNSDGSIILNDDNGAVCSGLTASIVIPSSQTTITSLAAGTYFIVAEGYSSNTGTVSLSVSLTVQGAPTYNTKNFIRTWEATAPETNANTLMDKGLREVKQSTTYFDGLGRPEQSVVKKGSLVTSSGANTDLVTPFEYDQFGREIKKYLPYVVSTSDGLYKTTASADQLSFNQSWYSSQNENSFYAQTDFEASPLNRVSKQMAPGASWAGSSRGVSTNYWINTTTDAVRIWNVTNGTLPAFGTYSSPGAYGAGELYKNVTVDEHNKQVIEFKDKEGKIILKKVQLTAADDTGAGSDHTGWLCTYYMYDDLGNLRCVIQPQGVELLRIANWAAATLTATLPEQCFRYEYDSRNRMVMKKVPGANEVYMVYDARDRLVMTQDAKLRASNKWLITLYDDLNRPLQTGLLLNTYTTPAAAKTFVQHLTDATVSTAYPFAVATAPTTTYWEYLTKTGYDDYSAIPAASGLTSAIDNTYNNSTYGINTNYNVSPDYAQQIPSTASVQTKGMVTWTETKVLGTTTYLYTVNVYDDKGRMVQVKSKNITGGADLVTTQYSWAGQPLVSIFKQVKAGVNTQTTVTVTKMTYDDLGRLVQTDKKVQNTNINTNALPASYTTVNKNEYDALGQLKKKKIGNKPGAPAGTTLANLDYDYNVRGWLLSINKDYITASSNSDQYFGMQLGYDKNGSLGTFAPQYNGNISGTLWKAEGDQQKRKYDFTYDAVNRLTKGDFTQYVTGSGTAATFNTSAGIDFSIGGDPSTGGSLKYDANGNIIQMWQTGLKINTSSVIDKLTYTYNTNSNKLLKVFDNVTPTTDNGKLGDFKDGTSGSGNDYTYDVNGNLTADNNKAISAITYNHLNLPLVITVTGKGTITYTYDAAGNKQKKTTAETGATVIYNGATYTAIAITTTTTYLGGAIFESKAYTNNTTLNTSLGYTDKLQFIGQEEGRIRALYDNSASPNTLTGFAYDYMLKDHLGNVRTLLTEEQKTIYYPAATLEGTYSATSPQANSMINFEKQFYNIENTKVVAETDIASWPTESVANTKLYYNHNGNPPSNLSYPSGCTPVQTDGSTKLYKLNAATNRTGLEFVIKVMAGDKIDIFGKSYFLNTGTVNNANSTALDLATLMANLLTAPANGIGAKGVLAGDLTTWNTGLVPSSFFRGTNGETTSIPKAYINYIFLDEQFKYAGGSFSRVGSSGVVKDHWYVDAAALQNITVPKNGYIFVYVSNESNLDVFFDNLQVIHKPGPLLEETHYYPFGLPMAGISSKALSFGQPENKKKYQSYEYNTDFDINLYETFFRSHDPQLGRFWQIDPKPTDWESPYAAMGNNPILNIDILGDSIAPGRTRGKNFFVTADKELRKKDIEEHTPTKGIFKKLRGFFSSAYAVDNAKARIKSVLSFGKMKVITASNPKEATDKIINKLGDKGYVKNLTIDYHAGTFGNESLSGSTAELSRLAGGYSGDATTCYLGQCWAGGNTASGAPDYTGDISNALDGATTYGNQAAASSISFALFSHFIGVVPQPYGKTESNRAAVGKHTVTGRDPTTGATTTRTTTNIIRIENSGKIVEEE